MSPRLTKNAMQLARDTEMARLEAIGDKYINDLERARLVNYRKELSKIDELQVKYDKERAEAEVAQRRLEDKLGSIQYITRAPYRGFSQELNRHRHRDYDLSPSQKLHKEEIELRKEALAFKKSARDNPTVRVPLNSTYISPNYSHVYGMPKVTAKPSRKKKETDSTVFMDRGRSRSPKPGTSSRKIIDEDSDSSPSSRASSTRTTPASSRERPRRPDAFSSYF